MTSQPNFIAYRSRKRMGILLALLVAVGLIALFLPVEVLVDDTMRDRARQRMEVLIMILRGAGWFALIVSVLFLPKLLRAPLEIRVGPDGIEYPPALREPLPWDRIERVAERKMSLYRVLSVFIRDADDFPIKPMARKISALNQMSGDYGDINIETLRSTGDYAVLKAVVERYVEVEPVR